MTDTSAYVIGLRVDPETEVADWYTLWHQVESGEKPVLTVDGRVRWSRTVDSARNQAEIQPGSSFVVDTDLDLVCDVALMLGAVSGGDFGNEPVVLDSLNLLYDLVNSVGPTLELPNARVLDLVVKLLMEGKSFQYAVTSVGGEEAFIEPILASLGRIFAWSTFLD